MRRLAGLFLVLLTTLAVVGCSNAPAASNDPYQLARQAMDAKWDSVQVDVGITAKGLGSDFTLDPGAIRIVSDTKAQKVSVHFSIPTSILGSEAAGLGALGITGSTLDLDVVYDGQALYTKSPALGAALVALMSKSTQLPAGDLTGWLRLGTKADFESLAGSAGPSASEAAESPLPDAATLKKDLEAKGITLTYAGSESKNGADADHLKVAVDVDKLSKDPQFATTPQASQIEAFAKTGTVSADVWLDKSSHRVVEVDGHFAQADKASLEVTVGLKTADATTIEVPKDYVDLPLKDLIAPLLQQFGNGMFGG